MSGGAIILSWCRLGLINADYLMRFVEFVKGWHNSTTSRLNDISDDGSINRMLSERWNNVLIELSYVFKVCLLL